jgi:uncharacterized protein YggT (Ycf19 family)
MGLIDSILNLASLVLWLSWRSLRLESLRKSSPLSLAATLKRTEPRHVRGWIPLGSLLALLFLRALFYWHIGSELNWTPNLQLGVVSLAFRSDYFLRILVFSFLSFSWVLAFLYAWLLLISAINRKVPNDEPMQRLVRLHLGWVERWPTAVKLLLPTAVTAAFWGFGSPALVRLGIVPAPVSAPHLWLQALFLGVTSILIWKILVLVLCLLYFINSYVYLGEAHFWRFVNTTGANLLRPLRRLPVCIGKVDLSPVLGIGLVIVVAQCSAKWLPGLFQRLSF